MISVNGFGSLSGPDSYGNTDPVEGTSLPSTELLTSAWTSDAAPSLPDPPRSSKSMNAAARPPASPSSLVDTIFGPPASLATSGGFPPPTKGGAVPDKVFGFIPLPSWLPKWAAYGIGLAGLAFVADYGYRHFVKGGRRVVTNPKARKRRKALVVEGDDRDLVERAAEFREKFHWGIRGRKKPRRAEVADAPRVLTKLGELTAVTYKTKKRGEKAQFFYHEFGEEGGKPPILGMDIENKKLHIVGGTYDVQADGIID